MNKRPQCSIYIHSNVRLQRILQDIARLNNERGNTSINRRNLYSVHDHRSGIDTILNRCVSLNRPRVNKCISLCTTKVFHRIFVKLIGSAAYSSEHCGKFHITNQVKGLNNIILRSSVHRSEHTAHRTRDCNAILNRNSHTVNRYIIGRSSVTKATDTGRHLATILRK